MTLPDDFAGLRSIFLDTAPIIYHVEAHPIYASKMRVIFQQIEAGALQAVTSPICLAECLIAPLRRGNLEVADRLRRAVTLGKNTRYVGIDFVAEQAAALRAQHNLTLTDAFQAACALATGCDGLLTNDPIFRRIPGLRILVLDDLRIQAPSTSA